MLGLCLALHDNVGLPSVSDVFLGVNFVHFAVVAEQLKQRILDVHKLDPFVEVLHVDCIGRCEQLFVFYAAQLLLERVLNYYWLLRLFHHLL